MRTLKLALKTLATDLIEHKLWLHADCFAFFEATSRTLPSPIEIHFTVAMKLANKNFIGICDHTPIEALASLAAQYIIVIARCTVTANCIRLFSTEVKS